MSSEDFINSYPETFRSGLNGTKVDIVFVCNICFRQYTLIEDLRGHLIEYHKFKPKIEQNLTPEQISLRNNDLNWNTTPHNATNASSMEMEEYHRNETSKLDIRPMPFRNLRVVLRSKMILR